MYNEWKGDLHPCQRIVILYIGQQPPKGMKCRLIVLSDDLYILVLKGSIAQNK